MKLRSERIVIVSSLVATIVGLILLYSFDYSPDYIIPKDMPSCDGGFIPVKPPDAIDGIKLPRISSFFTPNKAQVSSVQLPPKVKTAFDSTIIINAMFLINSPGSLANNLIINTSGTGFSIKPGFIFSARHIFMTEIYTFQEHGFPFILDSKKGLPRSLAHLNSNNCIEGYSYNFYGTSFLDNKPEDFHLELIKMGDIDSFKDFSIFQANSDMPKLKSLELEENIKLDKSGLPDLNETYYISGRVPVNIPITRPSGTIENILIDFLSYNFSAHISGIITDNDMPDLKRFGIHKMYRLDGNAEPGFSGGPVLNKDGKVVGITILRSDGIAYAISAEDMIAFLRESKN